MRALLRALLGGALGAVVSTAAWLTMDFYDRTHDHGWMVCLIGLVTGICVHRAAGKGSGGLIRGALAVALTFAAIVLGPRAYVKILTEFSPGVGAVAAGSINDSSDASKLDLKATDTPAVEVPKFDTQIPPIGKGDYSKAALKKNFSQWDTVWMSLAALAAYITGKGGDKLTTASTDGKQSKGTAGEDQESSGNEAD